MFLSLPFQLVLVSVFEPIQLFFNHGHINLLGIYHQQFPFVRARVTLKVLYI